MIVKVLTSNLKNTPNSDILNYINGLNKSKVTLSFFEKISINYNIRKYTTEAIIIKELQKLFPFNRI
jgi:hypothetical protein